MKHKFIDRVLSATFLLALIFFLVLWNYNHFFLGLSIFLGAAWGCANLLLIKHLLEKLLLPSTKNSWKSYFLLAVKFPLLYFIGYILLSFDDLSAYALMGGFSLLLATTLGVGVLTSYVKPIADNCHGS